MTYTLTFLLAVVLARSGSSGRAALIRTLIAAGSCWPAVRPRRLRPGPVGRPYRHSVPLLLIWLLLDCASRPGGTGGGQPRKRGFRGSPPGPALPVLVPVLTACCSPGCWSPTPSCTWSGLAPGAVAAARWSGFFTDTVTGPTASPPSGTTCRSAPRRGRGRARVVVNNLLSVLGGFTVNRLLFHLTPWHDLRNSASPVEGARVFGASYTGLSGIWLALAFLHMASVLVVLWALAR